MTASTRLVGPVARASARWLAQVLPTGAKLTSDSREVRRGDAFFAYPGALHDGRAYIDRAIAAGAAAILAEAPGSAAVGDGSRPVGGVPERAVVGLRAEAGPIASVWLGEPSERLTLVAVTGTNGKTSCTHWIAQGWNAAADADRAAVIGTLGAGVPGQLGTATLTTPDALALQQCLADLAGRGIELIAVEASSIGLDQGRLNGSRIAVAVLTNLTRDHLDYHRTLDAYADAKARLFAWPGLRAVVVNLEDALSARMLDAPDESTRRIGYLVDDAADITGAALARADGCDELLIATVRGAAGHIVLTRVIRAMGAATEATDATTDSVDLQLGLIGRFNLSNALAVAGVWSALGWSLATVAARLESLRPVPGRLEVIGDPADASLPLAVVDYAHTPDALVNALGALRPLVADRGGRLWCVFGAGGNRDRGKRPVMAAAAEAHADRVVLTSDNPRNESPDDILAQLLQGLTRPPHRVDADRARAIAAALAEAAPDDVVLIAGKGHEAYQEIAGVRHPFSDVDEARRALAARAASAGAGSAASVRVASAASASAASTAQGRRRV